MKAKNLMVIVLGIIFLVSCKKDNNNPGPEQATTVQLNKTSFSLVAGGREKLLLIIDPVGVTVTGANWSSSDTKVATVDDQGVVTALAIGETTITVTIGSSVKEQCIAKIIASPIKNLQMPDAKYPIAKDAVIIIQGEGFTKDSKIILRRNTNLKSASDAGDILAQIKEQTLNYISFYGSFTPGGYSVVLEQNNVQFDLGNIDVEIPNIPEYAYDKNKIFWEDTHWRRFRLRGKVKEIKIKTEEYTSCDSTYYSGSESSHLGIVLNNTYKFNKDGLLEYGDIEGYSQPETCSLIYDVNNRLIKEVYTNETTEYIYGNHEFYCPIYISNYHEFGTGGDYEFDNNTMWVKGLTQIKYKYTGDKETSTTQITPGTNSATVYRIQHRQGDKDFIENSTYTYKGSFPIESSTKYDYYGTSISNTDYEFSSSGMPTSITSYYDAVTQPSKYVKNCPFYLYLEITGNLTKGISAYEYDKNWNLSKITTPSEYLCGPYTYYYQSYDKYGNWTQCKVIGESEAKWGIHRIRVLTRDFTYWE